MAHPQHFTKVMPEKRRLPTWEDCLRLGRQQLAGYSESASLDAEVLLMHTTRASRSQLRTWPERLMTEAELERYLTLLKQRQSGQPIAYLQGQREFWSRNFIVTPDTLIPRQDSECIVEQAIKHVPESAPYRILDLGTGSGIIAITMALECPHAHVFALDTSWPALMIARKNAQQLECQVSLLASDWMNALAVEASFDMILSNPPYIAENDPHLSQGDLRFEPRQALASGTDGLAAIRRIAAEALPHLVPRGWLMLEHGYDQGDRVASLLKREGYINIGQQRDLGGTIRVTMGQKN